jgi:hypothetical protein
MGDDVAGCPSGLELALLRAGDLHDLRTARIKQHVAQCLGCRERVDQLDAAESEFLAPMDGLAVAQAAHDVAREAGRRRRVSRAMTWGVPGGATLLAASFVLMTGTWRGPRDASSGGNVTASNATPSATRAKGSTFSAQLFRKRQTTVTVADDGTTFAAGDRLRFAYTTPHGGYVAVFGVDGAGHIAPYYPASDLGALAVQAGQEVLLPDAIELDADPSDERLFLVFRETPWTDAALRETVRTVGAAAVTDARLPLAGFEQASWLVKRR